MNAQTKILKLISFAILICAGSLKIYAQDIKRTAIWYFGSNAGLDFKYKPASNLTNSKISPIEGSSSISDTNAQLVLYTDGISVYNKSHLLIDNGSGLLGESSSTQNSLIIPQPKNDSIYFLFTVNTGGAGVGMGFRYNIINIKANSGLGKVQQKNTLLINDVTEKICAVKHSNGIDYWVCVHGSNNNSFYLFLLTSNGLIPCVKECKIGLSFDDKNLTADPGAMKFSPNGELLAVSLWSNMAIELFEFDASIGSIANHIRINNIYLPYGIEFSKSGKFLYVMETDNRLLRFNLENFNKDSITQSQETLFTTSNSNGIQGLQLALDDKIYLASNGSSQLGSVATPDSVTPNFTQNGITLSRPSRFGLPNFVTSYFYQPEFDFEYQTSCSSNIISFQEKAASPVTSRLWKVLKGSVVIDSSQFAAPNFSFSDSGWFSVQWIVNGSDTVQKQIFVDAPILLANDTLICNQPDFALIIPESYRCLAWQDGSDTDYYAVSTAGSYSIKAYDSKGCWVKDSILVEFDSIKTPNIRQSNDTLFTDSSAAVYEWRFNNIVVGANAHFLKISQNGSYSLTVKNNNGCENSSSFNVTGLSANKLKTLPVEVYPNPSNGSFFVEFNDINTTNTILIRNLLGQIVFNTTYMQTKRVEVALGKAGIYFIEISDNTGKAFATKLIVKQ